MKLALSTYVLVSVNGRKLTAVCGYSHFVHAFDFCLLCENWKLSLDLQVHSELTPQRGSESREGQRDRGGKGR